MLALRLREKDIHRFGKSNVFIKCCKNTTGQLQFVLAEHDPSMVFRWVYRSVTEYLETGNTLCRQLLNAEVA